MRGWGAYFRTGNAAVKFLQIDWDVEDRLRGLLHNRHAAQLRPGQADRWRRPSFEALGLVDCGLDSLSVGHVRRRFVRPPGSRVREIRTHGLKGVLVVSDAASPAESASIYPASLTIRMPLGPGTRLGPYEIQTVLGAGMGEVYRARDMSLGRQVAIKVLPEAFAQDAERIAR